MQRVTGTPQILSYHNSLIVHTLTMIDWYCFHRVVYTIQTDIIIKDNVSFIMILQSQLLAVS